ncbi:carbonate dehydratase [Aquabacterium sp. A7-Y]|uniref:carbonate dehydratase n=1 Tax=Aquabacterium sp. A7-Y TaxID=1349605 RepID=UPI00223E14D1|nr:carbonate dehydratase [Aquabacterium sp. A7-Y]MCW7537247.1 carbonate dehydratase [Aquabacterium sp. A7-Y]
MSKALQDLFDKNRSWAQNLEQRQPGFFSRLLEQQAPEYLWIGCSDSRVPANEIVGLMPGDLFVHRNVANVVVHSDLNCLSVMEFAIDLLKVRHIMVVGHYGCSGVKAAMNGVRIGIADNWLRHVEDVRNRHQTWLDTLESETQRHNALCELNVLEQAVHVCQTSVVREAWTRGQEVVVHGWVYGLHNGLLQDLRMTVGDADAVQAAYQDAVAQLKARYDRQRELGAG